MTINAERIFFPEGSRGKRGEAWKKRGRILKKDSGYTKETGDGKTGAV